MRKLNSERLEQTLRQRLWDDMDDCRVSAAHLLVLQEGQEVVSICEGYRNWDTKEPLRKDAMYRLASMTKPVTGVAALIAEDKGYFDIHDKLEIYMPEFADMYVAKLENGKVVLDKKSHTPLRIYHLLSHCSGMMAETPLGSQILRRRPKQHIGHWRQWCATQPHNHWRSNRKHTPHTPVVFPLILWPESLK